MNNPHFFTLTELQEMLGISDRKNLKEKIVELGIPHAPFMREAFIATESFVKWIQANEKRRDSEGG